MASKAMDRQYSAPPATGMNRQQSAPASSRLSRLSKYMKTSVADFFGVGEEMPTTSVRWEKRRSRYAQKSGKLKPSDRERVPLDEVDAGRRIIDPLRVPGRGHSEGEAHSRSPLSSTSTHARSLAALGGSRRPQRKESVYKMTWNGLATLAGVKRKAKAVKMKSRSFAPGSLTTADGTDDLSLAASQPVTEDGFSLVDDVFFDEPVTSPDAVKLDKIREESEGDRTDAARMQVPGVARGWRRPPPQGLPSTPGVDMVDGVDFGLKRITKKVIDQALTRNKRHVGMGIIGRCLRRKYRSDYMADNIMKQMDDLDDHRPYFTYWVTFVQFVVFIVSVAVYGIAPIGIGETVYSDTVRMPNLAMQLEHRLERDNLWIGPRQADLIHLGAKYSPCMHWDSALKTALQLDLDEEKTSGCCVRNDGSGCAQMVRSRCSDILSTFVRWSAGSPGYQGRTSGAVCGQDPQFCKDPRSVDPFLWPDDMTQWPICKDTDKPERTQASTEDRHMTCEVVGHPCCHGIQGECIITTREHCDLKRGYYHEEAFLCSQVKCMGDICGMIPFSNPDDPDQFYRLFTTIFLHGGLVHLVITILFQMLVMRDMEKLTGAIRMAIIYLGSGIAGNLASAIFLPYQVEAGPSGAQFGILACLLVEVLQMWQLYNKPVFVLLKLLGIIIFLFLLGLLPWFDNWAHLFGFLFGFLLAFAIVPYISFGQWDRRRKIISIIVSLGAAIGLFVLLVILFYVAPITDCPGCKYFNCIPFTADFCKNMEVSIKRNSTYSQF